jgi:hypothetical protein
MNYVAAIFSGFFRWETLPSGAVESSSTASRVDAVASGQIKLLKYLVPASTDSPFRLDKLSQQLIQGIAVDYFTLQDWGRFSQVTKGMRSILNEEGFTKTLCPILYRNFEKQYLNLNPNIINLDKLGARQLLGFPEYKELEPKSIGSLKDRVSFLRHAGLLAKLSEDGKSVIVTIPAGWSIEKLEVLSQAAVAAGTTSARIEHWDPSSRTVLQNNPVEETQKVAISNTVIKGSRNKSTADQKALLKAEKLEEEFPDLLMVLTEAVLRRVLSKGSESSYNRVSEDQGYTYTRTNKKMPQGWTLCVCSAPSCVLVDYGVGFDDGDVGVGGLRKFEAIGS